MSITQTLSDKELDVNEKLSKVAEVVAAARKAYGNSKVEIEDPSVSTSHGVMPFSLLEADSKVVLLQNRAAEIKAAAIEATMQNPAKVLHKEVEMLLATDPYFSNIDSSVDFDYL